MVWDARCLRRCDVSRAWTIKHELFSVVCKNAVIFTATFSPGAGLCSSR